MFEVWLQQIDKGFNVCYKDIDKPTINTFVYSLDLYEAIEYTRRIEKFLEAMKQLKGAIDNEEAIFG